MNYLVCIWCGDRYHVFTLYVDEDLAEACRLARIAADKINGFVHKVEAIR